MVMLDNVLETANQLTDEQQDIMKNRLHEARRKQMIQDCHVASTSLKQVD
jgi:hypothetical protein